MTQEKIKISTNFTASYHFERDRLNQLFLEAMKFPLISVCAGAGYGKTTAVHDFVQEYRAKTVWVQLSERDNVGVRFWENFSHSMMQINVDFAESLQKLGFPDTQEKIRQYHMLMRDHDDKKRKIVVFDDCHFIEDADVIKFVDEAIRSLPVAITVFLISRSTPRLNIAGLSSNDKLFEASENALRFTESELGQYFREQGIIITQDSLRTIWQDTEGWAFALNFIARSYKKAPGYEGYLRNAMKTNIFRFMETEIWNTISARLQDFLVRLSLIDHLSIDLIAQLAGADIHMVSELEKQNAYVRIDSYINAFLIHPLFLEFLATKQDMLTSDQKRDTYTIAGAWCNSNGFKIDALSYYEKIGNYKAIVDMFIGSPAQIPYDVARFAEIIFNNAPLEMFSTVIYLASTHLRTLMCQGRMIEADKKAAYYEEIFLKMPQELPFRRSSLCSIYYCWIIVRAALSLSTDVYDFHLYSEKLCACYLRPIDPGSLIVRSPGLWICVVGTSRKEALHEYISALKKSSEFLSKCFISFDNGEYDLALGELSFYQCDTQAAESHIANSLNVMRKNNHADMLHKALFYSLRIAFFQGNYNKVQAVFKNMKAHLDNVKDFNRFIDYDMSLCWYYCALGLPEKTPDWLKENFSPYTYAGFIENYADQMRARFHYKTRNFSDLLSFIQEMKKRESFLFGRIELLVFEACIHYKLKDKEKVFAVMEEAYDNAQPNGIIMPFVELGKDMRTLVSFMLRNYSGKIPKQWLEDTGKRAASYAKRLSHITSEYRKDNRMTDSTVISPRETEILTDLSHGLSRGEIASSRNLSINTVKMLINNIYMKLGAENLADAIRIATERKIV